MPSNLEEKDWDTLIKRINDGKCTAFLGAGACHPILPLGKDLAEKWAKEYDYPLEDCGNLSRVAQFMAVDHRDPMFPKDEIAREFKNYTAPDFNEPDEPHGILADLPISIYITTNYDDFMMQALKSRNKDPKLELCLWNKYIKDQPSIFESKPDFVPNPANPVVFHLHGYREVPESLVLTEDDLLDFVVNISRDQDVLPPIIKKAIAGTSLLFIGYRLADWNFRAIFRGIVNSMEKVLRRLSVSVQFPRPKKKLALEYLTEYFKTTDVLVYWGKAREFARDLRERWEKFNREKSEIQNKS